LRGDPVEGLRPEQTVTDVAGMTAAAWSADTHAALIGDVDGDGRDDVLLHGTPGAATTLLHGDPAGFARRVDLSSATDWSGRQALLADVNGDGADDVLLLPTTDGGTTTLLLADGAGAFSPAEDVTHDAGMSAARWSTGRRLPHVADLDGDGDDDLLLQPRTAADFPVALLADGAGSWALYGDWTGAGGLTDADWAADHHSLTLADLDGDGDADVIAQGAGFGDRTWVIHSQGGGLGARVDVTATGGFTASDWRVDRHTLTVADLDGDGALDVLLRPSDDQYPVRLALGRGDRTFAPPRDITDDHVMSGSLWADDLRESLVGDLDGDGKADVLLRGRADDVDTFVLFDVGG